MLGIIEQTYIPDQDYLGSYIIAAALSKKAELEIVGTAHQRTSANSRVRIQAETKSNVSGVELKMYLWHWTNSSWDLIGTHSLGGINVEGKFESVTSDAGGASPYINGADNKVKAKLVWQARPIQAERRLRSTSTSSSWGSSNEVDAPIAANRLLPGHGLGRA